MSTFKEKAVTELLTVLPADQKGATAFLAGAARAAGALHMRGKRCNLVLSASGRAAPTFRSPFPPASRDRPSTISTCSTTRGK